MDTPDKIKEMVKQKYSEIALQDNTSSGDKKDIYTTMSDDYKNIEGYNPEADLGLGCGLPTQFAKIKKGDTVIDLGSGAGNDCFIARNETGETGKVIGIDLTEAMIKKAQAHAEKLGYTNVEFRLGDLENMPVEANIADVIVSNGVLNLVPDKQAVFNEIFRVLKVGGHFSISDIVLTDELPEKIKTPVEMYVGRIASAIDQEQYLNYIAKSGFQNITLQDEKPITIPDEMLKKHLTDEEIADYKSKRAMVYSITMYAEK
jgi:ubiquinone/menaquinone biosynthesis C-methylase UbiE